MTYSLIFDAHLDLSMNAMDWNRDLTQPLAAIREREAGGADKPDRGRNTVCFPEMRRGRIGLCVATLIARYVHRDNPLPGWNSPAQAWAHTQGQLAWYRAMEQAGELVRIQTLAELDQHVAAWESGRTDVPVGYILSLEGADSIRHPDELELAWEQGLRALGPAHYGPGTYAKGTNSFGGLGPQGSALLRKMEELGMILDLTHLSDKSFWEALDHFNGRVWASHNNCRTLVNHQRQFSDEQLREIIRRDGVIGMAM
ncbi:MAG: membrane dipeptidase, partial [Bacteroidota bacterium]